MAESPIKFGILGGATIARKVSRAINLSPNSLLYAIASRSVDKATKFAKDNAFPDSAKIYGSYEALLDDPEVDVVYMPLPTSLHIEWAVLAARNKKHILLEKPVALNVAEFDVILEACESNGVQIMDATMWMHHPRTAKMEEFLSDALRFGKLKFVQSTFSFLGDENFLENNIRVKPDLDALGALGDAGWYCIRAILWAADYHLPKSVVALHDAVFNSVGVIIACGASMEWEDGRTATFHCSFLENLTMDATIVGTNGALRLHDFIIPYVEDKASFSAAVNQGPQVGDDEWEPRPGEEIVVATDLPQEALMVSELSRLVASIKLEGAKPEKKWPTISRKTQLVVDAVKASIDKGYQIIEVES